MEHNIYPIDYDESKKISYIHVTGELNAEKIQWTYLTTILNYGHNGSILNILYILKNVIIPENLDYGKILRNAEPLRFVLPQGRSAAVIEDNSATLKQIAEFYAGLATGFTDRDFKLFEAIEEAEAWIAS